MSFNAVHATAFQLFTQVNDYKDELAGEYEVRSKIIWSSTEHAPEGKQSLSSLSIEKAASTIYAHWIDHVWTTVRSKVLEFTPKKLLHWELDNKYEEDDDNYWFVRTVNTFDFSQDGQIKGKSYHKLYHNGNYEGAYITQSYLIKL